MNGHKKIYGASKGESPFSESGTEDGLKPFVGDPENLSRALQEEIIYRFQYEHETEEFLAIEYRLTPSSLRRWLDLKQAEPVDLSDEKELKKLEDRIEREKNINSLRLTGSILVRMNTTWEQIARAEQSILETIERSAMCLSQHDVVDPKAISTLTKAHTAMVKQQLEKKSVIDEGDNLANLTGLLSKKLENLFTEIDNLSVV